VPQCSRLGTALARASAEGLAIASLEASPSPRQRGFVMQGVLSREVFHRQEKRETSETSVQAVRDSGESADERRHDETTTRLLALAVRFDVVPGLQVLVHHLALERRHRLERDRAAVVHGRLRRLIGGGA